MKAAEPALRRMAAADLDQVAANESEAFAFPWPRSAFVDCLDAGYECWVAVADGQLVGHGILSIAADEAALLNVCVAADAQGLGYGRALSNQLIGCASAAGAAKVFLEVRMSNRPAMTLYAALGFREIGRRPNYYRTAAGREDALVMVLDTS